MAWDTILYATAEARRPQPTSSTVVPRRSGNDSGRSTWSSRLATGLLRRGQVGGHARRHGRLLRYSCSPDLGREQFRLFCLLENADKRALTARGLRGPAIAVITGMRKKAGTVFTGRDYAQRSDSLAAITPYKRTHRQRVGINDGATGATGLEPATSGVTGRRSNQLSYAPACARTCRPWGPARDLSMHVAPAAFLAGAPSRPVTPSARLPCWPASQFSNRLPLDTHAARLPRTAALLQPVRHARPRPPRRALRHRAVPARRNPPVPGSHQALLRTTPSLSSWSPTSASGPSSRCGSSTPTPSSPSGPRPTTTSPLSTPPTSSTAPPDFRDLDRLRRRALLTTDGSFHRASRRIMVPRLRPHRKSSPRSTPCSPAPLRARLLHSRRHRRPLHLDAPPRPAHRHARAVRTRPRRSRRALDRRRRPVRADPLLLRPRLRPAHAPRPVHALDHQQKATRALDAPDLRGDRRAAAPAAIAAMTSSRSSSTQPTSPAPP